MRRRAILLTKSLIFSLSVLLLFACSPANYRQDLQVYQQRLANVLAAEPPVVEQTKSNTYPTRSELLLVVPQISISLRTFYNLDNCPAKTLIAERNTALGRTQMLSQRLVYEHKLIAALQQCISNNPEKSSQLQSWLAQKQHALPKVWANMLQLSDESKTSLTLARKPLRAEDNALIAEYKFSWEQLIAWQQQQADDNLEAHLQFLKQHPLAAKVWQAQTYLTSALERLTPWLENNAQHLECKQPQMAFLTNVFQLFFVEKIQPLGNSINQFHYQMTPIFDQLTTNPALTSAFQQWLASKQQDFVTYQQSMRAHVGFWQGYFKQCGVRPGQKV